MGVLEGGQPGGLDAQAPVTEQGVQTITSAIRRGDRDGREFTTAIVTRQSVRTRTTPGPVMDGNDSIA